ncbi:MULTISPECIES: YitT family protein [unclassified Clostridioides]|uniref:YitT family protein n=1 Tax=unclassified Clostridioides TaxID=2635829 RepID=UPI001D123118|nr:YitT family protein [Clostridioides sp. ES-S-0171-01]MCC0689538.1 YitT family protein [Clostridioides sp. ES-S-0056-01]UDN54188.1 YitT family protein [Clostridioides sp. ES-S-0054-01]
MKKEMIKDYLLITISAFLMALAVNFFFAEHTLAPGGITGLSVVLSTFLSIPVENISLGISMPLLVMGVLFLGKGFGIKTLYITLMGPLFLKVIPQIHITDNLLVAGVIGGLLVGTAIGIAIIRGCSTGGTDLVAMLINKIIKFLKLPVILFMLDGFIIVASGIISKNFMISIYSLISLLLIIKTIGFVTTKFDKNTEETNNINSTCTQ